MDYLLKSSALLLLMYLGYAFFLKKETFFNHNRWFLIIGIVTAAILPLVEIPIYIEVEAASESLVPFQFQYVPTEITIQETPFDWLQLATYMYWAGVAVFLIQFLFQFGSLAILLLKNSKNTEGIYTYVIVKSKISPFSFFKWIVYNPDLFSDKELQLILNHEKVHVRQWHSVDILVSRLACVAFWFNPICWFYYKSIQQNLEYIADDATQNTSASKKDYQELLLKTSIGTTNINLTSNFYNSLIKKRIVMLQKSRSKSSNRWKSTLVIPFFILFLMSFNTKDVYVEVEHNSEKNNIEILDTNNDADKFVEVFFSNLVTDNELKTITKQLQDEGVTLKIKSLKRNKKKLIKSLNFTFMSGTNKISYAVKDKDGIDPFMFTMENGKMKVEAVEIIEVVETPETIKTSEVEIKKDTIIITKTKTNSIAYRANYSFISEDTTVINKPVTKGKGFKYALASNVKGPILLVNGKRVPYQDGKKIDTSKIAEYSIIKAAEAIKTYGQDGALGVMVMTLKEGFDTIWKDDTSNNSKQTSYNKNFTLRATDEKDPIYILNGKRISKEVFKTLNPNNIEAITVHKDKKAVALYGKDAKDGAIEITTKNKKEPWKIVTGQNAVEVYPTTKQNDSLYIEKPIKFSYEISKIEYIPSSTKVEVDEFLKSVKKPLIIINNEVLGYIDISDLDQENIKEMTILKSKKATEFYGDKGKNGAISIYTKDNYQRSLEERKKYAQKYNSELTSSGKVENTKPDEAMVLYFISKITPNSLIEQHINQLKSAGITAKVSKLKRNNKGEITKIKIKLYDNSGNNSEAVFSNNKGISTIKIGKQGNTLVVSSEKF